MLPRRRILIYLWTTMCLFWLFIGHTLLSPVISLINTCELMAHTHPSCLHWIDIMYPRNVDKKEFANYYQRAFGATDFQRGG